MAWIYTGKIDGRKFDVFVDYDLVHQAVRATITAAAARGDEQVRFQSGPLEITVFEEGCDAD